MRLLLLLLVASGCDTIEFVEVGDLVITQVEAGYLIETEADYPCANYPLVVDVDLDDELATVEVQGVGEIEGCLTALGPASVVVPYPESDRGANPTHELVIEKGGATDQYASVCGVAGCSFGPINTPAFSRLGPR